MLGSQNGPISSITSNANWKKKIAHFKESVIIQMYVTHTTLYQNETLLCYSL